MSTGTQALTGAVTGSARKSEGLFRRVLARIAEGQERRARTMVREYLATQTDAHLLSLGYSAADIKTIRSQATGSAPSWL